MGEFDRAAWQPDSMVQRGEPEAGSAFPQENPTLPAFKPVGVHLVKPDMGDDLR
jgi:hypothetical protein